MIDAVTMKAELLAYWRYERQCPLVGIEVFDQDVLTVTKSRSLIVTEVKVSISDLRADGSKEIHFRAAHLLGIKKAPKNHREAIAQANAVWLPQREGIPNQFYFAVPPEIAEKAAEVIEQRYPYAGLIVVNHNPHRQLWGHGVVVAKTAPVLHKQKASIKLVSAIVKSLTASLASAYKLVVKSRPNTGIIIEKEYEHGQDPAANLG